MSTIRMKNRAILIVEDEPSVRRTLTAFLEHDGFTAYSAGSIEAAAQILASHHVDALVLDLGLSAIRVRPTSGLDLLSDLRVHEEYQTLPILIFTGRSLVESEEELIRKCGAHVFPKPQPYRALVQQLDKLIRAAA